MRSYLLVHSITLGTKAEVKACLDSIPDLQWRTDMIRSFYLLSEKSAKELAELIRRYLGDKGRFVITEISPNRSGWLPRASWDFIKMKS